MAKILIAYYSRKGQNYVNGAIKNLAKGNTEVVAEMIQRLTGGDLFEIDTVKDYPVDYTECTNVAKVEIQQKARPELKGYLASLDAYDKIFLGYPIWWSFRLWQSVLFLSIMTSAVRKFFRSQRMKVAA